MMESQAHAQQPCEPQKAEPQKRIDPLEAAKAALGADAVAAMLAQANKIDVSDIREYK